MGVSQSLGQVNHPGTMPSQGKGKPGHPGARGNCLITDSAVIKSKGNGERSLPGFELINALKLGEVLAIFPYCITLRDNDIFPNENPSWVLRFALTLPGYLLRQSKPLIPIASLALLQHLAWGFLFFFFYS